MKKYIIMFTILFFCLFLKIDTVSAASACTTESVEELTKILLYEYGGDFAVNPNDNFFVKLTTASVAVNNASKKSGNSWQEKIYNLPDNQYQGHSTYKDKKLDELIRNQAQKGELVYISALVLSGKYNVPQNIIGQASCKCSLGIDSGLCTGVDENLAAYDCTGPGWAKEWTHVDTITGLFDSYFAYSKYDKSISNVDVFGNKVKGTTPEYYKSLANSLKKTNYTEYTSSNVCSKVQNKNISTNTSNKTSTIIDACTSPDILRVIYFFTIILDIVKIAIPIGLIVMGLIDFSKSVITNDEQSNKKSLNLFLKRLLYGVLIFAVPWIIEVLMITLGNLSVFDSKKINFTDCLENANSACIEALESGNQTEINKYCDKKTNPFK